MKKYTFISYYRGGTYISQVLAPNKKRALILWAKELDYEIIKYFGPKSKEELNEQVLEENPSLIDGLNNIWYVGFLINGSYMYAHIIKTELNNEP